LEWEVKDRHDASYDYIESNRFELGEEAIPGEPGWHTIDSGILSVNEIILTFRRGFVAEVHAPLATLQQHLPALVQSYPIERVRATNMEPIRYDGSADTGIWPEHWSWWRQGNDKATVGDKLFKLLISDLPVFDGETWGYECKNYSSLEAAHAALSVVLLKEARDVQTS